MLWENFLSFNYIDTTKRTSKLNGDGD